MSRLPCRLASLPPRITAAPRKPARDTFDLALANKLIAEDSPVIRNDFYLKEPERIFVVSGPNQGGRRRSRERSGSCVTCEPGLPVPGTEAQLFLFDGLFSHFEKEEDISDLSGKLSLAPESARDPGTGRPRSVVIMNETFSSTTLDDALLLGTKVLE